MTLLLTALALALAPPLLWWAAAALPARRARRGHGTGAVWLTGYAASLPLALWALSAAGRPAGGLLVGFVPPRLRATLVVGLGLATALGLLSLAVRRGGALLLSWAYRVSGRSPAAELPTAASARRFPAPAAFLIAITAAGYEELVWRGFLQAGLAASFGAPAAVVATSLAFAALHARQGPVAAVFSAVAAALLGAAFVWHGNLAAVMLAHAAYNASAVAVDRWGPPAVRRAAARSAGARLSISTQG